jgi:hypothetical protein
MCNATLQQQRWAFSYIELLQRLQLYVPASVIIVSCGDEELGKMNQKSTTIALNCPSCNKPSTQVSVLFFVWRRQPCLRTLHHT